jgi:hypothetical protein
MKTKQWILVVSMMGVLFATAFANDNNRAEKDRLEHMKERVEFFKENVKPKVDAQRSKLEEDLSTQDKAEIERLREELIKQRLMANELRFEARTARIKGEEFDEGLWQEIEAQKIVIENLMDEAKIIANKYRPEIDDLVSELREQLKEDVKEKRADVGERGEKYGRRGAGPGHKDGSGREFKEGPHGRMGHGRDNFGRGFAPGMDGRLNIVTFLLWDVSRG